MPLCINTVQTMIEDALPGADVQIKDLAGDNDHYEAIVKAQEENLKIVEFQEKIAAEIGKTKIEFVPPQPI